MCCFLPALPCCTVACMEGCCLGGSLLACFGLGKATAQPKTTVVVTDPTYVAVPDASRKAKKRNV